jgi:cell wall-associated NlpC family hydrolase
LARYELLIDGRRRWKAASEDDVRRWLAEYRDEHAADDPDATHVQVRRLSAFSWVTGGRLLDRMSFMLLVFAVFAAPAQAALQPGQHATIDVAVATLWKAPNLARAIDRPSLTNPVDPARWSGNLATTESRVWLDSHVQTQALYAQDVVVLARQGGWAKVAVVDEPDPQDPHGYPGWLPMSQLKTGYKPSGPRIVIIAPTASLQVGRRRMELSYGTVLSIVAHDDGAIVVDTPDGRGSLPAGVSRKPLPATNTSIVAQAKRFLGVHYLWGGLSAWGFDCSGLIWDVYRAHGMTIPRDADPQFHHGVAVARSALRPGDLLFFGSPSYAEHVSLYVGGGRMLEAPDSAHRVRIVPVRWTYYIGARRYLSR